jgi:site-specific DNA-methyltransferase (adenine-specific)
MKFKERTEHPTQKPVKLIKTLILQLTNENQIIFDPFMGSGTTAIACLETNRQYIGCELNTEYYQMCLNRINDWHKEPKQLKLDIDIK